MPLEDPNDPNVVARGVRMRRAMPWMHALHANALQVALAQHMFVPTSGGTPMASEYVAQASSDVATVETLEQRLADAGYE